MSVELLVFPLSMGYFLDFCTLPLFPSGTLHYRWTAQFRNPLLSAFVHWLAGTMFMYVTAFFATVGRADSTYASVIGSPLLDSCLLVVLSAGRERCISFEIPRIRPSVL